MEDIKLLKSTVRGLSYRYNAIKKINSLIAKSSSSYDFLEQVLALILDIFSAEGAAVMLKDNSGSMKVIVFRASMPSNMEKEAKSELEGLEIPEKNSDESPRLYREKLEKHIKSLKNKESLVLGCEESVKGRMEIYNLQAFSKEKKESLQSIASQTVAALEIFQRLQKLRERASSMRSITEVTEAISKPQHLEAVLDILMKNLLEFFNAGGCSILLKDSQGNVEFTSVSGEKRDKLKGQKINPGEGIAGWCMENDKPVLVAEAARDKRFSARTDEKTGMKTGSLICAPLKVLNEVTGVLEAVRPEGEAPFREEDIELLIIIASHASVAIDKARLYSMKDRWLNSVISLLVKVIDSKDSCFSGHSEKVISYVRLIADEMNLKNDDKKSLEISAVVKEIGKLSVPDNIISKENKLSEKEWQEIKQNPLKSIEILQAMEDFDSVIPVIKYYRENYDGTGYPMGLQGEEIPFLSRVLAISDAYAAMLSSRPYRKALSEEEAKKEILNNKSKQFDPGIADAFIKALKKTEKETINEDENNKTVDLEDV